MRGSWRGGCISEAEPPCSAKWLQHCHHGAGVAIWAAGASMPALPGTTMPVPSFSSLAPWDPEGLHLHAGMCNNKLSFKFTGPAGEAALIQLLENRVC